VLTETIEALGLPADAMVEPAPGGASGAAWRVRAGRETFALRLDRSGRHTDGRLAAMAAARDVGIPAPRLLRRAATPAGEAVLLSWLPGVTMLEALDADPAGARSWGQLAGALQRRLHAIAAPGSVLSVRDDADHPFHAGRTVAELPDGGALLHLDWHPLNLLVDPAARAITGVVDWDNARRGHPSLDVARTRAMLTMDPTLASLPEAVRKRVHAFVAGWADGYGAIDMPAASHLWAARVMLADLAPRHAAQPALLDPLRSHLASLEG
jgi:aminoglycoside phosphotransferase (APT) family kinase protein